MKPKINVDISGIEKRFSDQQLRAKQAVFAQRVGFDMNKRCPEDSGTLKRSMDPNSNYEGGLIVWNTPYAKEILNADSVRTVKNPHATPNWPEATKQERLKDWRVMANALLCDENTSFSVSGAL